jgi:hypothetical protein
MGTMPRHPNVALGGAFAAGALAVAAPWVLGYALFADDLGEMRGPDVLTMLVITVAVITLLPAVLVAGLLMRLRRFPWRNHAHPARIAAAFGAAGAAAGLALATALEDGFSAVVPLIAAAFALPFVHRRIP